MRRDVVASYAMHDMSWSSNREWPNGLQVVDRGRYWIRMAMPKQGDGAEPGVANNRFVETWTSAGLETFEKKNSMPMKP